MNNIPEQPTYPGRDELSQHLAQALDLDPNIITSWSATNDYSDNVDIEFTGHTTMKLKDFMELVEKYGDMEKPTEQMTRGR